MTVSTRQQPTGEALTRIDASTPIVFRRGFILGLFEGIGSTEFSEFKNAEQKALDTNPLLQIKINTVFGGLISSTHDEKMARQGMTGMLAAHHILRRSAEPRLLPFVSDEHFEAAGVESFVKQIAEVVPEATDKVIKPSINEVLGLFSSRTSAVGAELVFLTFNDVIAAESVD